jgi:hypothetical protein
MTMALMLEGGPWRCSDVVHTWGLSLPGSTGYLWYHVSELRIVFLFKRSPKAAMNPHSSMGHPAFPGAHVGHSAVRRRRRMIVAIFKRTTDGETLLHGQWRLI